jgi:hypothetical protein
VDDIYCGRPKGDSKRYLFIRPYVIGGGTHHARSDERLSTSCGCFLAELPGSLTLPLRAAQHYDREFLRLLMSFEQVLPLRHEIASDR